MGHWTKLSHKKFTVAIAVICALTASLSHAQSSKHDVGSATNVTTEAWVPVKGETKLSTEKQALSPEQIDELLTQVLEEGREEYITWLLASDDSISREDAEYEFDEDIVYNILNDDWETSSPDLIVEFAPKFWVDLINVLRMKWESEFWKSLYLSYQINHKDWLAAELDKKIKTLEKMWL